MSELPSGWTETIVARLMDGGLFIDGDWVETKDQNEDGEVRLTQLADIGEGCWRNRSNRSMTRESAERLGCTYLEKGDVLVARMPDPLGRACIFPGDLRRAVTVVDVCVLRPDPDRANPNWLMWFLNAPPMRAKIAALQSGTTRKRISRKNLGSLTIPVPPRAEQQRIVEVIEEQFSRLDAAEASLRKSARSLVVLHDRSVEALLRCFPRRDLGVALLQMNYGTSTKCSKDGTGAAVLRIPNIRHGRIDISDLKYAVDPNADISSSTTRENDVLFIRTNGSRNLIGRAAAVGKNTGLAFASYLIRGSVDPHVADPAYVALSLTVAEVRAQIEASAASTAGQHNLNLASIRSLKVPLPDIADQKRAVLDAERQRSLYEAISEGVTTALRRSHLLRRAVLETAFSGKLGGSSSDTEVALIDRGSPGNGILVGDRAASDLAQITENGEVATC